MDDEKPAGQGEREEEEGEERRDEEPENQLTLQLVDKYPMLPEIDSTTPLDSMKKILRAYVHAVRSAHPINISPLII